MKSRFSSLTALPLCLIWFLACWPATSTGQRNPDPSETEVLATEGATGLQQAQEPQPADTETASKDADPLFPIVEHRMWGYIDKTGKVVIPPKFYWASPFNEGKARIEPFKMAVRYQYIDKSGTVLPNQLIFSYAAAFSEGLACVVVAGEREFSYIDGTGKRVIEQDRVAGSFKNGLAAVGDGHKYGYIDKQGKEVIPLQFDRTQAFNEGLAPVMVGKSWGFIDTTGKMIIAPKYELAVPYYEGITAVKLDGKWGYIDKAGEMVIPPQFVEAFGFRDGRAQVKVDKKWGYIDTAGKMAIPAQFENAAEHTEGMAPVKLGGKWGFVDTAGKMVVAPQFDMVGNFANGLAEVKVGRKWGYIDKTGKYVWTPTD
jgi:WG containing repeat